MYEGYIDGGLGTYPLDVKATFSDAGEVYQEVLVFRDFCVTFEHIQGARVGVHTGFDSRSDYREFVKYLAQAAQKVDECDCEAHYSISSEVEFFVRGQDV